MQPASAIDDNDARDTAIDLTLSEVVGDSPYSPTSDFSDVYLVPTKKLGVLSLADLWSLLIPVTVPVTSVMILVLGLKVIRTG